MIWYNYYQEAAFDYLFDFVIQSPMIFYSCRASGGSLFEVNLDPSMLGCFHYNQKRKHKVGA